MDAVRSALRSFAGVEHRLEEVTTAGGVLYVNDSKATNVASTLVALQSFDAPVHLILGGVGKGQDFTRPARPGGARVPHRRGGAAAGRGGRRRAVRRPRDGRRACPGGGGRGRGRAAVAGLRELRPVRRLRGARAGVQGAPALSRGGGLAWPSTRRRRGRLTRRRRCRAPRRRRARPSWPRRAAFAAASVAASASVNAACAATRRRCSVRAAAGTSTGSPSSAAATACVTTAGARLWPRRATTSGRRPPTASRRVAQAGAASRPASAASSAAGSDAPRGRAGAGAVVPSCGRPPITAG